MTNLRGGIKHAETTWIPSRQGQLAAFIDVPDGDAHGVVVIAPPLAREYVCTYRGNRALAHRLAQAGHVVIRFNWRGEANSTPYAGEDLAAAFAQDLDAVIDYAHAVIPAPVDVVGVRLGAALTSGAGSAKIGRRVLFQPVAGKRFLREQEVLRRLSIEADNDAPNTVEIPGRSYTSDQAASLKTLKVRRDGLVIEDPDAERAARFYAVDPEDSLIPRDSIDRIVAALPIGPEAYRPMLTPVKSAEQVVRGVRVRATWLEVGPNALPGILHEPVETPPQTGLVFSVSGSEPFDGPTGLWSSCGWALAGDGFASIRAERWGQGELMLVDLDRTINPYNVRAVDDTAEMIRFMRAHVPGEVVGAGLCVGSWMFLRAAESDPVDRFLSINSQGWYIGLRFYERLLEPDGLRKLLVTDTDSTSLRGRARRLARTVVREARNRGAYLLPPALQRTLSAHGIVADPVSILRMMPEDSSVVLAFGPADEALWRGARGPQAVRQLRRRGPDVTVERVNQLDHALLTGAARRWTRTRLGKFMAGDGDGRDPSSA